MLEKCVLTILEFSWNQRLGHKKTKLKICHHALTSSTQLQNWSFHVVERTRTSTKCQKMKNARAKRTKILFFIVKYANLWGFLLLSSSWLLKPGFLIVVSAVRKKLIGQIQLYGNLPYKCSIQKKRRIQLVVRDRMNSICPMNFFSYDRYDRYNDMETRLLAPFYLFSNYSHFY